MFSLSARFPSLSQNEKFLLDMRKDFLIMSNVYLVEILSEPNSVTIVTSKKNSVTIVTSKKILKMSNYVLILSIFFLIIRIRNLECWMNLEVTSELTTFTRSLMSKELRL